MASSIEVTIFSLDLPIIEWLVLSYLATIAVALLTYHLVEMPFPRLKNRISITKSVAEQVQTQKNVPPPITYTSKREDSSPSSKLIEITDRLDSRKHRKDPLKDITEQYQSPGPESCRNSICHPRYKIHGFVIVLRKYRSCAYCFWQCE